MGYLICPRCNGYYKLRRGESPDDFSSCQCGGRLFYSEKLGSRSRISLKRMAMVLIFFVLISIVTLMLMPGLLAFLDFDKGSSAYPNVIGANSKGMVTKEVYSADSSSNSSANSQKTVAIVTGIHPREKLSQGAVSAVIKDYKFYTGQKIVHYHINVTEYPENYNIGRSNGEDLAATFILPDIQKSNYAAVIICHDHQYGYGEGYYLATPKMDAPSVGLAESLNKSVPGLNYFKATKNMKHGSSTIPFTNPVASAGYKTLVYEIPEWETFNDAYQETSKLIKATFGTI